MPSSSQRPIGDVVPAVPLFSYAQAAKGKVVTPGAVPLKPTNPERRALSEAETTAEVTPKGSPQHGLEMVQSSQHEPSSEAHPNGVEDVVVTEADVADAKASSELSREDTSTLVNDAARNASSSPPSPDFGTTSASIILKDDDALATPNTSSESTWDRVSQTSQIEEKTSTKLDEEEDTRLSTWEHVATPAQLKEAPPPAINVWLKRAEAKVLKDSKTSHNLPAPAPKSDPYSFARASEVTDRGRGDCKKKVRGAAPNDQIGSPTSMGHGKLSAHTRLC